MQLAIPAERRPRARRAGLLRSAAMGSIVVLAFLAAVPSHAADAKPRIQVDSYDISAELQPRTHRLVAHAVVKFTALEDISVATFELHNALRPTKVVDAAGKVLNAERISQDNAIRVALPDGLQKGQSSSLTFDYEGTLSSADDSPVQGLKLAYVGDDTSYLLYSGRWFPMVGYGTNRFTATIKLTVPSNWVAIGSGLQGPSSTAALRPEPGRPTLAGFARVGAAEPHFLLASYQETTPPVLKRGAPRPQTPARAKTPARITAADKPKAAPPEKAAPALASGKTYTFVWNNASFPGTIIAGQFVETTSNAAGLNLHLYFKAAHKDLASQYSDTAVKEFQYYAARLGPPLSNTLRIVELPDDTVPTAWGPEVAAIASHSLAGKVNYRLLANTIAHQWYGVDLSPASKADWWISDGFARYEEARYVEYAAGETAFEEVVKDLEVGALAYDTVPLSSVGRLDPFAPEFQALTTDKGAIILNMLRWVVGDAAFDKSVAQFVKEYRGKPVAVDDLRKIVEGNYGDKLTWFFSQWLDSTGAPEFKTKYTVYRVAKGFRVVGEIAQDLDLFRMPVELKIETDGQSEDKRIEVIGTNSAFAVETFGRPRRIVIDPGNRVLKNSAELRVRASILRGQGLVEQGDLAGALQEFQKSLENNKNSSLAHYRIAEVFFLQHNYQASANEYRECLNGDGEPRWTEVWSHIQLGKIFDITGQRERATNEYRQALQTNDNTQGAMDEARKYLQSPYSRDQGSSNGQ